jgi:hypothetical protein
MRFLVSTQSIPRNHIPASFASADSLRKFNDDDDFAGWTDSGKLATIDQQIENVTGFKAPGGLGFSLPFQHHVNN